MPFAQFETKTDTLVLCDLYFLIKFSIEERVPYRVGIIKMG